MKQNVLLRLEALLNETELANHYDLRYNWQILPARLIQPQFVQSFDLTKVRVSSNWTLVVVLCEVKDAQYNIEKRSNGSVVFCLPPQKVNSVLFDFADITMILFIIQSVVKGSRSAIVN